jgi:hypothetical protein
MNIGCYATASLDVISRQRQRPTPARPHAVTCPATLAGWRPVPRGAGGNLRAGRNVSQSPTCLARISCCALPFQSGPRSFPALSKHPFRMVFPLTLQDLRRIYTAIRNISATVPQPCCADKNTPHVRLCTQRLSKRTNQPPPNLP